jgi:hypothetical protein
MAAPCECCETILQERPPLKTWDYRVRAVKAPALQPWSVSAVAVGACVGMAGAPLAPRRKGRGGVMMAWFCCYGTLIGNSEIRRRDGLPRGDKRRKKPHWPLQH